MYFKQKSKKLNYLVKNEVHIVTTYSEWACKIIFLKVTNVELLYCTRHPFCKNLTFHDYIIPIYFYLF